MKMFNKQNFCHIASNNRNDVKVGVFVYKTTDNLDTVKASGYFNEKIIDINLHDLIIHEWHDPTDRTKVQYNLLCVTERTLDNVGTTIIHTKWDETVHDTLDAITATLNNLPNVYLKLDGTNIMTGPLKMRSSVSFKGAIAPSWDGVGFYKLNDNDSLTLMASMESTDGLTPAQNNTYNIGKASYKWKDAHIARVITAVLNNGYDIAVPVTNQAETLALKSDVDLAANSGRMITDEGVWYAKMDAAGTIPAEAAVEGRNYADFTQVDVDNNPIIVIYTYTSGAWTQTETITPPAEYDGYVPVTSKIWDIQEQAGQQGGRILWNHQSKDFTPYPLIISFEDAALSGTPTAPNLSAGSPNNQIVNKQSLNDALVNHGTGRNVGDIFFTARTDNALNGAVECNGAIYNTTDFTGAQSIGELLEDGKVPYVSMADYATALAADGSVGVFGWDGTGNTTFKVPTLTDIFIETGTAAQVGDYLAPSAPNVKATVPNIYRNNTGDVTGALNSTHETTEIRHTQTGGGWDVTPATLGIDASQASPVYKDSATTIQPNAVRYRAMIQLAISASDEAVATCTAVTSDVANLNTHRVIEFQAPTAQNNYTWYRKYADGWVEQGGHCEGDGLYDGTITINLPVTMSSAHYHVQKTNCWYYNAANANYVIFNIWNKTTTSFDAYLSNQTTDGDGFDWEVKGMAA